MKRLVICCDGTWSKPDNKYVTNVEKIARTVQNDPDLAGASQLVYYISGVGAGSYGADRLLGGAFGFGISHNLIACYRFLAQNYEPGDEIFIFGFSRGAYTARSLAGMIAKVGLLTEESLVEERLRDAVHWYQQKPLAEGAFGSSIDEFRHDHCHSPDLAFLGVFDTVGALGVPGFRWRSPKFHDVQLSDRVRCARQALAIDETRLIFAPTLWELPATPREGVTTKNDKVKQVWFEGAHSDIGGGYSETGLSDTALLWMVREAHAAGLVFDAPLLEHYVNSGSDPIRHNPLTPGFRIHNLLLRAKMAVKPNSAFIGGLRRLSNDRALSVKIATSATNHYAVGYEPANLQAFATETNAFADPDLRESVVALPERGVDVTRFAVAPPSAAPTSPS